DAVLCFKEDYYENFKYFEKYFELERGIKVGVIDSAHGDNFSVFDNNNSSEESLLGSVFDGARIR
ncbi:MAG: hypothetical protein O7C60_02985, partial [Rickettsia endosymbiont of Ixodes persulcatus]|nr:hypothetical protein [Rickettsia endosymbiont of Ixodes persulcatus]